MGRKARVGITRDLFDQDGNPTGPGPGPKFLEEIPGVEYDMLPSLSPEVTPEQVRGFDIAVGFVPKWTALSLAGNDQLIALLRGGVGYDYVDVPALNDAAVLLCTVPPAVRRPMAVAILTFILTLSTHLRIKDKLTRQGRWAERDRYHGVGLTGKTLGSIGVGNIGHELFKLAQPFGIKPIACDPYSKPEDVADVGVELVDMDTVLAESDFLNISCPLNEQTRGLIGEKELHQMKKTAFLINTARGPIVDEAALIKALQDGVIQGAGLDVFQQEPTPPDNPLLTMENVIVTPHALCLTDEFFTTMWQEIARQVSQIICGEIPQKLINREVWDKPQFQSRLQKFREALR
jgi:D-3-phosphoglycerate dehydrogenase